MEPEYVRMDSEQHIRKKRRKRRRKVEEGKEEEEQVDRLSSLPDDLIHKILSFNSFKEAARTSKLSSRWRYIWTSVSCLEFSSKDFSNLDEFSKHVRQILSSRNKQTDVSSLYLSYHGKAVQPIVKRILNYAFSHNIQQLNVSYEPLRDCIEFPLALFGSQTLKHLKFTSNCGYMVITTLTNLELPALTTLYLQGVTFGHTDNCVALFSKCPNLKNLTLNRCKTKEGDNFSICHPQLSNLTLKGRIFSDKVVNVVTPQLENLIIEDSFRKKMELVISAPNLASLVYGGDSPLQLSTTDGFHFLKEADICFDNLYGDCDAHQMICLFQQLHNVKVLKLNLEIVEFLSSRVELISHHPSPFVNLNSLTIFPKKISWGVPKETVIVSDEVERYLQDGSPGATFLMTLREEIKAKKDMAHLWVLLREAKANIKTSQTDMGQSVETLPLLMDESTNSHKQAGRKKSRAGRKKLRAGRKKSRKFRESVARIQSCWNDLISHVVQGKKMVFSINSELLEFEKLLMKLPPKKRSLFQPSFSSLCAETNTLKNKIAHSMKMQFNATMM